MPPKLPSLSNIGIVIIILKVARGDTFTWVLLLGVIYGSAGATMTLLAKTVAGGKLKVFHTPVLVRALAIAARRVVIGALI